MQVLLSNLYHNTSMIDSYLLIFSDTVKNVWVNINYQLRFKENTDELITNAYSSLKYLRFIVYLLIIKLKNPL